MKTTIFFNFGNILKKETKNEFIILSVRIMIKIVFIALFVAGLALLLHKAKILTEKTSVLVIIVAILMMLLSLLFDKFLFRKKFKKAKEKIQSEFEKEQKEAFKKFYKSGNFGEWMAYYSEIKRRNWNDKEIENFLLSIPYMRMVPLEMEDLIEKIKNEYSKEHEKILLELKEKYIG